MIRKGLFHSTKAISEEGANIFEIETPKIKHDIVRLEDKYGREGKPYEGKSFEKEKDSECIFFSDPLENQKNTYIFKNSKITLQSIIKRDAFLQIEDDANIIFLNGGIQSNEERYSSCESRPCHCITYLSAYLTHLKIFIQKQ